MIANTTIREAFLQPLFARGYELLPERSAVRDAETYFVMSSVAAHIEHFLPHCHQIPAQYATIQRTLSADKVENTGRFPLANPYEVMGSFFHFCDPSPEPGLELAFRLLAELAGIERDKMYYRTTSRLGLHTALQSLGADPQQIVVWKSLKQLSLGPNRPKGEYIYLYAPYRHGFVPVAVLGFIPLPDGMAVDSAFFLERLTMMRERQLTPLTSSLFTDLTTAVQASKDLAHLPQEEHAVWVYAIRALVALLWDGAQLAHRYSGHVVKKFVRQLGYTLRDQAISLPAMTALTEAAAVGLQKLGYEITDQTAISQLLRQVISNAAIQIHKEIMRLASHVTQAGLTEEIAVHWEQERGLKREWMLTRLNELGIAVSLPHKLARCSLKNDGYPFDTGRHISFLDLLQAAEGGYQMNQAASPTLSPDLPTSMRLGQLC